MLLPLVTIGVSQLAATQVVAGLAQLGLGISQQTVVFMSAMMIGAGVDYAVFLISRYHEYLRQGLDSDQAVARALSAIGKVIAASAATVAVTFLGMGFTTLRCSPPSGLRWLSRLRWPSWPRSRCYRRCLCSAAAAVG